MGGRMYQTAENGGSPAIAKFKNYNYKIYLTTNRDSCYTIYRGVEKEVSALEIAKIYGLEV